MDNAREQVLGQFGSVTGPAKVLEALQDGVSFGHAVSAGRHLWKAIQVVIAVVFLCAVVQGHLRQRVYFVDKGVDVDEVV